MERIKEMALGFMVYLLILGALYMVSDEPQSNEQPHGRLKGAEENRELSIQAGGNTPFSMEGSTALNASTNPEKPKGPVQEIGRSPGSSYIQTGKSLANQYNFLEIIPFMEN